MSSKPEQPAAGRINVHIPADLNAPPTPNFRHDPPTSRSRNRDIDFAQILPQVPKAHVKNRVIMTAYNAKLLLRALTEHMARFDGPAWWRSTCLRGRRWLTNYSDHHHPIQNLISEAHGKTGKHRRKNTPAS